MKSETELLLPKVSAGFPSPASDYLEPDLDFNAYLVRNPSSTFSFRVEGESMMEAGIPHNCIVVVDRSIRPRNNSVVVATLDGERIIKYFLKTADGIFLVPANRRYKSVKVTGDMDFCIWGTVTHAIIEMNKNYDSAD